jgi:endogenous inhibitor of DNA gyrase (YacG/DUF329 family)
MASVLSLPCPKCGQPLKWAQLRSDFECPSCKTKLRSNHTSVAVWTAVLLPIPFGVAFEFGAVWIVIAIAVSLALYFPVVKSLTTVTRADQEHAT